MIQNPRFSPYTIGLMPKKTVGTATPVEKKSTKFGQPQRGSFGTFGGYSIKQAAVVEASIQSSEKQDNQLKPYSPECDLPPPAKNLNTNTAPQIDTKDEPDSQEDLNEIFNMDDLDRELLDNQSPPHYVEGSEPKTTEKPTLLTLPVFKDKKITQQN